MKCLLTGATGLLGRELITIAPSFDIEYWLAVGSKRLDITNQSEVETISCNHAKFDKIVHCAAYTNVTGAETNRRQAVETNIMGTRNISLLAERLGVPLVYISTDYVYPGTSGNYKETDFTKPVNFYALTKLAGEAYASAPHDLIIRTSFKPSVWKYDKAFSDIYTSADYTDVVAALLSVLIVSNASGIYNVGTQRKSIFELAQQRNTDVKPMLSEEIGDVSLPSDISMNTDKYDDFINSNGGKNGR